MSEDFQDQVQPLVVTLELPSSISHGKDVLQVETTYQDSLPQLKETLSVVPKTRNLTSYNLFFEDVNLTQSFDEMATFGDIMATLGLEGKPEVTFRVSEKPYNLAAVYEHLLKFRQVIGLHFFDVINTDNGTAGGLSKFVQLGLTEIKPPEAQTEVKEGEDKPQEVELSSDEKAEITKVAEALVDAQLADLLNYSKLEDPHKDFKLPVKSLTISPWSPVPSHQHTKGDLFYLTLQTLENETFHLTCHLSGFFINKSSAMTFNPAIKFNSPRINRHFILYDLIKGLSPLFEKTIRENEENLHANGCPENYLLPTNTVVDHPWIVHQSNITKIPDLTHYQLPILANGVDGADVTKDWNEEFQAIRDLPRSNINERMLREKLLSKTIFDFTKAATDTAINVVNGNIPPMNISEDPKHLTFLRNGIFCSYGVDATGAFDAVGGDEASRYTAAKDVSSVKILNRIDPSGVYTLLTCVVDYLGRRIICQAPVPGIFTVTKDENGDEIEDKVVHGLNSEGSKILYDEKFNEVLKPVSDVFHIKSHNVELENGFKTEKALNASKDLKGIVGNDGRKYMIDLYRTAPLDINFIEKHGSGDEAYPHKEALIRHEAVEEWWKRKIAVLVKEETEKLEKEGKTFDKENGEKPQILIQGDQVAVNPDTFTGVNESSADQDEVRELSGFISILIDEFLSEVSSQLAPFDGQHLSSILHRSGINLRYLGTIADNSLERVAAEEAKIKETVSRNEKLAEEFAKEEELKKRQAAENKDSKPEDNKEEQSEEKTNGVFEPAIANLKTLYRVAVQEMVARGAKHVLRSVAQDLPPALIASFVAHFMNCLLGGQINEKPICFVDESLKSLFEVKHLEFTKLTSADVLELVEQEVFARFRFKLPQNWVVDLVKPVQLLREVSIKFGIQWKARKYVFTKKEFEAIKESTSFETEVLSKTKKGKKAAPVVVEKQLPRSSIFSAEDILSFNPVVKDSSYKGSLLDEILETAKAELEKDQKTGVILFNELLTFYEQIFGRVHKETASYYGYLSQLFSDLNVAAEACNLARIGCILNERVYGFDSFNTLTSYINAAFFESTNKDFTNSLKLYKHVFETWSHVYGDDHPSLVTTYANLAESLSNVKMFAVGRNFFEKAIALSEKLNGEVSEVTGLIKYRFGYCLIAANNFKDAKDAFSEAYSVFEKLLGPKDHFTRKSLSFATNLKTYLEYQKNEKLNASKVAASAPAAVKKTSPPPTTKKGKKKNVVKVDESIATQSVDDILAFIEGKKNSGNKKK